MHQILSYTVIISFDILGSPVLDYVRRRSLPLRYIRIRSNNLFVGREIVLGKLKQMFFSKQCHTAAIAGLGGVGKTQVALKFAYWVKETKPEYSVLWVPALSQASFEQACTEIAKKLYIYTTDEGPRESVQRYLSSEATGPWFLVLDNADDKKVLFGDSDEAGGISQYLPGSDAGRYSPHG